MTFREFLHFVKKLNSTAGKITISATVIVAVVFAGILVLYSSGYINAQSEATPQTSVTVLNTAPVWPNNADDAHEDPASSVATPTNSGDNVVFKTIATDSNGQNYYLLICKTGGAGGAVAANGGNPPACDGGAGDQWAVSASTASGAEATATYTTNESDPDQQNDWFAYICDSPVSDAACNSTVKTGNGAGDGTDNDSPFITNFRPSFTVFNDGGVGINPGATETWTTTASDSAKNTVQAYDIRLYVCKANDFTGSVCGAGGEWCNSGAFVASDPTCNAAMEDPKPDGNHDAFGFVIDEFTHAASGGAHGTNSTIEINNVAPSVLASSIDLLNTTGLAESLELSVNEGETAGFKVEFTVTDQNSCENQGGGDEIASAIINVYTGGTGGVGQGNCRLAGVHDRNDCYPAAAEAANPGDWTYSCSQDETVEACSGITDNSVGWSCTFPLWFNAKPTAGTSTADSPFWEQDWRVEVQADDDDALNTGLVEGDGTGGIQELLAFTAFEVPEAAITYGSLEAGENTDVTNQTTALRAVGNTGLDEELEGTEMCTTFNPATGEPLWGCLGNATDTIFATDQKYNTLAFDYDIEGNPLPDRGGAADTVAINVPKTTVHTAPESLNTFWGIQIPASITLAGSYSGRNFILGVVSDGNNW